MSGSLLIPEYVEGVPTFVPYAVDIQRLLREGDPTIGWEGDERLYITPRQGAEGYAIGRVCEDGVHRLICTSKPPHRLDKELLVQLRDHDTRKVDVLGNIEKHNAQLHKDAKERATEHLSEGMERVIHGLRKDVGFHY